MPRFMLKVHNCAQSFVLCSYTMDKLYNQHISIGWFLSTGKQLLCFVHGQGQKSEQKPTRTLSSFITIPLNLLWLNLHHDPLQ